VAPLFFGYFSGVIALTAVLVVALKNPIYSALSLLVLFFHVAGLYVTLHAEFLAAVQIIVYAGAVMVLFLFVIMLLNLQTDPHENQKPSLRLAAGLGGAVLIVELFLLLSRTSMQEGSLTALPEGYGTVQALSEKLFTDYLIPFEVTSILLLVAAVGAVVLAKR